MVQQVWLHPLLRVLGPLWVYFESKRFVQVKGSEATTDQWFVSNRAAHSQSKYGRPCQPQRVQSQLCSDCSLPNFPVAWVLSAKSDQRSSGSPPLRIDVLL